MSHLGGEGSKAWQGGDLRYRRPGWLCGLLVRRFGFSVSVCYRLLNFMMTSMS